ncbi:MAG: hypothetical protein JNK23_22355 [Opitutaceae bacterium]|nr:hypothetical protein [Opitutaceae bacterium]
MRPLLIFSLVLLFTAGPSGSTELVPFAPRKPTATEVLARYGPPSQRIGADLWVYWNFPHASTAALNAGYDTLAVHVVGEEVRSIRLVNAAELRALLRSIGDTRPPAGHSR